MLFTPKKIGNLEIKNRFVHSGTYESMSEENGKVTKALLKRYQKLAKGEVGLLIPGYIYVHPSGKSSKYQTGIHSDGMLAGLSTLTDIVHKEESKIIFQLTHAGMQTTKNVIKQTPMAPSSKWRSPINFSKTRAMSENEIFEVIKAFVDAVRRAVKAGADGVQLHVGHGYLLNQFLSPFFNHRKDKWGGSDEGRFLILKHIITELKEIIPSNFPLLLKLNSNDFIPKEGIVPELAKKYATLLKQEGVDGIELSCGNSKFSPFNICRGEIPTKELMMNFAWWKKPLGKIVLKGMEGKFNLQEGYNIDAAKIIKPAIGDLPLLVVGGLRRLSHMKEMIEKGFTDFISMSRPFIREPNIVKRFKENKAEAVTCISCNKCIAAVNMEIQVYCYCKRFPVKRAQHV